MSVNDRRNQSRDGHGAVEQEKPFTFMFSVTREFHFCYGHRLLNYNGKCAHPHGHNGRVEITLESETLDAQGMVLDFSELKRVVNDWLDENLDHKMVLAEDDPLVPVLAAMQEPMYLMPCPPTAENLARLIFDLVCDCGYPVGKVVFWETAQCSATYSGRGIRGEGRGKLFSRVS